MIVIVCFYLYLNNINAHKRKKRIEDAIEIELLMHDLIFVERMQISKYDHIPMNRHKGIILNYLVINRRPINRFTNIKIKLKNKKGIEFIEFGVVKETYSRKYEVKFEHDLSDLND